jgi:hypothetical protein
MMAAIAATSLQLAGCGGASEAPTAPPAPVATATPTAPNAAGNRFDFDHFRIEFPDEFIAVDFGALDLGTALANATAKLAPEQREGFAQIFRDTAAEGQVRFLGFDGDAIDAMAASTEPTEGGYVDCVNILLQTLPFAAPRSAIVKANVDDLRKIGITVRSQSEVITTPTGPSGQRLAFDALTYDMPEYGAKMVAYIVVHDRQMMVLTFGAAPERFDGFRRKAESVLRTVVPR